MTISIEFKAGGTFSYGCLVQLPTGSWSAKAQLRRAAGSALVVELIATLTAPTAPETRHKLLLESPSNLTKLWPVQTLVGDVLFIDASAPPVVLPTSTFSMNVIAGVTSR